MSTVIDTAGEIRSGEQLDAAAVTTWLEQQLGVSLGGIPEVTQFTGGASNWTYRLKYPEHDWILRRPPQGTKVASAHDMSREYRIQKNLKAVYPYVPKMQAYCEEEAVIGSPFYVMERLNGVIPRKNLPRGLQLQPEEARQLCSNALDSLIALHKVDYEAAGLAAIGSGAGYVQRQIDGWCRRYENARTWNVPSGRRIMDWLQDNIPASERLCLTHNDYRFDNLVLDPEQPTRIIGVLDWELSTIGDPLMELGTVIAGWVEADDDFLARAGRRQPTHLPGMFTRQQVIDYYCEKTGIQPENWAFYEVYGLFRLAGIGQQIYYRYHHKQTRNPAFRHLWVFMHYLHHRCKKIIRQQP